MRDDHPIFTENASCGGGEIMKSKSPSLKNRVCLVTGSARKLGSAIARSLAEAGTDVAVHYLTRREAAEKTAKSVRALGSRCVTVRADVTREKEVERMFRTVEKRLGGVDILVNNVGNFLLKPLSRTTRLDWNAMLDSNLHSVFHCCRQALPGMRKQGFGRIINMGYGPCQRLEAIPNTVVYHMAKTALLVYTKGLAQEEAPHGITVNMVSPGTIFTSVNRPSVKTIPAGRYARYGDLTHAVLFLLKEESSFITGNNLLVTGGKYIGL
jgi:3-oxoacyl-[acyl-carrier protein] reductase